jgi:hypothetical protein
LQQLLLHSDSYGEVWKKCSKSFLRCNWYNLRSSAATRIGGSWATKRIRFLASISTRAFSMSNIWMLRVFICFDKSPNLPFLFSSHSLGDSHGRNIPHPNSSLFLRIVVFFTRDSQFPFMEIDRLMVKTPVHRQ